MLRKLFHYSTTPLLPQTDAKGKDLCSPLWGQIKAGYSLRTVDPTVRGLGRDSLLGVGQSFSAIVTEFRLRQCLVATFRTFFEFLLHPGTAVHTEVCTSREILVALQAFIDGYYLMAAI